MNVIWFTLVAHRHGSHKMPPAVRIEHNKLTIFTDGIWLFELRENSCNVLFSQTHVIQYTAHSLSKPLKVVYTARMMRSVRNLIFFLCSLSIAGVFSAQTVYATTELMGDLSKIAGESTGDYFGGSIEIGDINNDDADDLFVSATTTNYLFMGDADLFLGGLVTDFATAEYSLLPTLGDLNGDGALDLVFVEYAAWEPGSIYVIYGDATVPTGTIDVADAYDARFVGESSSAGINTVELADINGDNRDDLLIGTNYYSDSDGYRGALYIVYGTATDFTGTMNLAEADARYVGEEQVDGSTDSQFGSVIAVGDLNGDTIDDIVVSAHEFHPVGSDPNTDHLGVVYIVHGSTDADALQGQEDISAVYDAKLTNDPNTLHTGSRLAIGDLNGDGADDVIVLVGADYGLGNNDDSGSIYIMYGGTDADALQGDIALANFDAKLLPTGSSTAGLSMVMMDLNGDGYEDLVAGTNQNDVAEFDVSAYVFFGGSGPDQLLNANSVVITDSYYIEETVDQGSTTVAAGDIDGDGAVDLIFGQYEDSSVAYKGGALYLQQGYPDSTVAVVAATNGDIIVLNSVSVPEAYTDARKSIFDISTNRKTRVLPYGDDMYVVLHPYGKQLALVNLGDNEVLVRKTIRTGRNVLNSLQILDLRHDDRFEVVITTKEKSVHSKTKITVMPLTLKLNKRDTVTVSKDATVNSVVPYKKQLQVRSASGSILRTYLYSKNKVLVRLDD